MNLWKNSGFLGTLGSIICYLPASKVADFWHTCGKNVRVTSSSKALKSFKRHQPNQFCSCKKILVARDYCKEENLLSDFLCVCVRAPDLDKTKKETSMDLPSDFGGGDMFVHLSVHKHKLYIFLLHYNHVCVQSRAPRAGIKTCL